MSELLSSLTASLFVSSAQSKAGEYPEIVTTDSFRRGLMQCCTDHEQDTYVSNFTKYMKWQLSDPKVCHADTATLLLQCLYCHVLKYDVSFAQIYAVQLAQQATNWQHKRTAYLVCNILLAETSELTIMMVATIQRDLRSRNIHDISLALQCACQIVGSELIPAILHLVCDRLKHPVADIRKKAILCVGSFIRKSPDILGQVLPFLSTVFCDRDPSVMFAAVEVFEWIVCQGGDGSHSDILPPTMTILRQVTESRLPPSFTRNGVSGPWLLLKLIRLVSRLHSTGSVKPSNSAFAFIAIMDRYESRADSLSALAVVSECCLHMHKVTVIDKHMSRVSGFAGRLLHSASPQTKCTALRILSTFCGKHKDMLVEHQRQIVLALNTKDAMVRWHSLELLLAITTSSNADSIYRLFTECCPVESKSAWIKNAIKIIIAAQQNPVWILERLTGVLSNSEVELTPAELSSLSRCLLKSAESLRGDSENGVSCQLLSYLCRTSESTCESVLLVLPAVAAETDSFNDCDLWRLIIKACEKSKRVSYYTSWLFSYLRLLTATKRLSLNESQMAQLKTSFENVPAAARFLEDLERPTSALSPPLRIHNSKELEGVWACMATYSVGQVSSGRAREFCKSSSGKGSSDANRLVFTSQSDTAGRIESKVEELHCVKTIWTARGRVVHSDDESQSVTPSQEVTPDITSQSLENKLVSDIFSSLGSVDRFDGCDDV